MERDALRALIREKLTDGRLPHDSIPRVWGGPGAGETCHACGDTIPKTEFVMEGVASDNGKVAIQLHVICFGLWNEERVVPGR